MYSTLLDLEVSTNHNGSLKRVSALSRCFVFEFKSNGQLKVKLKIQEYYKDKSKLHNYIDLHCCALVNPIQRIEHFDVDLRAVEGSISRIHSPIALSCKKKKKIIATASENKLEKRTRKFIQRFGQLLLGKVPQRCVSQSLGDAKDNNNGSISGIKRKQQPTMTFAGRVDNSNLYVIPKTV